MYVCVCECVRGICFPSYIHTRGCPRTLPTHTQTHTLVIFATFGVYSLPCRLSARQNFLSACALCMSVYISTCLSACSVKSGHQGFFNCFLPPTAPKHCEAGHSGAVCLERIDREQGGLSQYLHSQAKNTSTLSFYSSFWFILCICKEDTGQESKRVCHAFSHHTCVGENKSPSIRVFSLTGGLRTICGLLLNLRQKLPIKMPEMTHTGLVQL